MSATDLVNGFLLGGLYVLVALGLSLAFGVMRLINLAHGALVIGAAYLALWLFTEAGLEPFAALPLVVLAAAVFGYLLQRVLLTHLMLQSFLLGIVGTFGLAIIAETAFAVGFTSDPQSLPSALGVAGFTVFGIDHPGRAAARVRAGRGPVPGCCTSSSGRPGPGRCFVRQPPRRGRRSSWASTCPASSGSPWPWPPGWRRSPACWKG